MRQRKLFRAVVAPEPKQFKAPGDPKLYCVAIVNGYTSTMDGERFERTRSCGKKSTTLRRQRHGRIHALQCARKPTGTTGQRRRCRHESRVMPPTPKDIDATKVEQLAGMFLTTAEIASVLDCSSDTLERRYAAALKKGRDVGKASLKRKMFAGAMAGNVTMQIWLSKNFLGMSDKLDNSLTLNPNVDVKALEAMTPAQRRQRIFELTGMLGLLGDGKTIEGDHAQSEVERSDASGTEVDGVSDEDSGEGDQ